MMNASLLPQLEDDSDDEIPPSMLFGYREKRTSESTVIVSQSDDNDDETAAQQQEQQKQTMMKEAQQQAQVDLKALISTFRVYKIVRLDQLRWHVKLPKQSGRKQRSPKHAYICFLHPDNDTACNNNSKYSIVQYIGSTKHSGPPTKVPTGQLKPFQANNDYTELYLNTLRREQKDAKLVDQMERTEKLLLEGIRHHFTALEQEQAARVEDSEEISSSEEEDDDDQDEKDETNQVEQDPQADSKPSSSLHRRRPVQKLRAGDYIRYCPEQSVFCHTKMKESFVTEVFPKANDDVAVQLASGDFLTRDARILILKRYLRNAHVDTNTTLFVPLRHCTLDPSLNGKLDITTLADRLTKVAQETTAELTAMMNHHATEDDEDRKRKRGVLKDVAASPDRRRRRTTRSTFYDTTTDNQPNPTSD